MPLPIRAIHQQFDPRRIAGCTGWYDAADSAYYVESSGQITDWKDKSGRGNDISQTTANNRPTLFESSGNVQNTTACRINGRQALFFDGTNDRLTTTATVTSSQSRTVFAVARRTNQTAVHTVATFGDLAVNANMRWLARYGTSGSPHVGGDGTATNQNVSSLLAWDSAHLSCWSQSGSTRNLTYLLNNTSYAITGNPPFAQTVFGGLAVGALFNAGGAQQFFAGAIGEIVVYDRELSAAERTAVTYGIAAKWGIVVA